MEIKHTKQILKTGWNDEIESMIINRKVGSIITDKEADILYPVFRNIVRMIISTTYAKLSQTAKDELLDKGLAKVFDKMIASFDREKLPQSSKVVNYFTFCIKRELLQNFRVIIRRENNDVSLSTAREDETEDYYADEILQKSSLAVEYDAEPDIQLTVIQKERFNKIYEWYLSSNADKRQKNIRLRRQRLLRAIKKVLDGKIKLNRYTNDGKKNWYAKISPLCGIPTHRIYPEFVNIYGKWLKNLGIIQKVVNSTNTKRAGNFTAALNRKTVTVD